MASIKDILGSTPNIISRFDADVIEVADYLLPYSVGIEFECSQKESYDVSYFKAIPNIIHVDVDTEEQRYRIPAGIDGLICLFNISQLLREHSELNELSGIHYHIDFTDCYHKITLKQIEANKQWILEELDSWEYNGTFNTRNFSPSMGHSWLRCQNSFKTVECRIGEMTFDYELLFERITHLSDIMRKFKEFLNINEEDVKIEYTDNIQQVLNNRIINI